MIFELPEIRARYQELFRAFRDSQDEALLLAFNELGIIMNRAGIPPEFAVETHALAMQPDVPDTSGSDLSDNTLLLPLMEVIMAYGLTFRQQLNLQQSTSEAQFYQVLEQSLDMVLITEVDHTITYANPSYCSAMGCAKETIEGGHHPFIDFPGCTSPDELWEILEKGGTFRGTVATLIDGKQTRSWAVSAFPLFDEDRKPYRFVLLAEDISQQLHLKKKLNQSKRLATIGEIASGVSHEFNNILLIISGFAELIRDDGGSDSTLAFADEILKAVGKGRNLNKQILSLASDRSRDRKPARLKALVKEVEPLIDQAVGENITLFVDCPDDVIVTLNEDHLCQILTNLCMNARHAIELREQGPSGCIRCLLRVEADTLKVTVEDNGTGMSREVIDDIFDPFFTTKRVGEGSGLGLSIVLRLVDQYEGQIQVSSELGAGTEFRISLPVIYRGTPSPTKLGVSDHD